MRESCMSKNKKVSYILSIVKLSKTKRYLYQRRCRDTYFAQLLWFAICSFSFLICHTLRMLGGCQGQNWYATIASKGLNSAAGILTAHWLRTEHLLVDRERL